MYVYGMRIHKAFSLKVNTNVHMFAQKSHCNDLSAVCFFFFLSTFLWALKGLFWQNSLNRPKNFWSSINSDFFFLPPVLGFNLGTYGHSYYLVKKTFTMIRKHRPSRNHPSALFSTLHLFSLFFLLI